MAVIKSIVSGYLLLIQTVWASSEIDPQEFLEKVCLVHASPVAPINNIKMAGALNGDKAIPFSQAIRTRLTLHHCVGGLVPEEAMGVTTKFCGIPISMPMHGGHRSTPFIFITPLSIAYERVYGGQLNDLFVVDQIEYGSETTVLVAESKLTEFKEKNPDFPGLIIPFNGAQVDTRVLVNQELERRNSWPITFDKRVKGEYEEVLINGRLLTKESIQELFAQLNWQYVDHNYSHFHYLEEYLGELNRPFLKAYTNPHNTLSSDLFFDSPQQKVKRHAIGFHLSHLMLEIPAESLIQKEALLQWQHQIYEWYQLYKRLNQVQQRHPFPGDTMQPWLKCKGNISALDKLRDQALLAPSSFSYGRRALTTMLPHSWLMYPVTQYDVLINLCNHLNEKIPAWSERQAVLSWFAIKHFFGREPLNSSIQSMLASLIKENAISHEKDYFEQAKNEFWNMLDADTSPHAEVILSKISHYELVTALLEILGVNKRKLLPIIDFDWLCQKGRSTKLLFNDKHKLFPHARFLKNSFQSAKPSTYKGAVTLSAAYLNLTYMLSQPINLQAHDPFADMLSSFKVDEIATSIIKENQQVSQGIYAEMRKGAFGTLDEIFDQLGVREEFREVFPMDEDFWNIQTAPDEFQSPSFQSVYLDLKRRASQKRLMSLEGKLNSVL